MSCPRANPKPKKCYPKENSPKITIKASILWFLFMGSKVIPSICDWLKTMSPLCILNQCSSVPPQTKIKPILISSKWGRNWPSKSKPTSLTTSLKIPSPKFHSLVTVWEEWQSEQPYQSCLSIRISSTALCLFLLLTWATGSILLQLLRQGCGFSRKWRTVFAWSSCQWQTIQIPNKLVYISYLSRKDYNILNIFSCSARSKIPMLPSNLLGLKSILVSIAMRRNNSNYCRK